MKSSAPWIELSSIAAALTIGMLVLMWAQSTGTRCALAFEAPQQLVLSREIDREHLATDLASADRIARRYVLSIVNPAEQQTRFLECEATLVQQIATRHRLSPEQVRVSATDTQ